MSARTWVQFSPPEAIAPWKLGMWIRHNKEMHQVTAIDVSGGRIGIERRNVCTNCCGQGFFGLGTDCRKCDGTGAIPIDKSPDPPQG